MARMYTHMYLVYSWYIRVRVYRVLLYLQLLYVHHTAVVYSSTVARPVLCIQFNSRTGIYSFVYLLIGKAWLLEPGKPHP